MFGQQPTEQNSGYLAGAATQTGAPAAIPTLVRALSRIEELNKRLYQLRAQADEIANAIGGPRPTSGEQKGERPPSSAMEKLNENVDQAHGTVSELESSLGAIRRSLGG